MKENEQKKKINVNENAVINITVNDDSEFLSAFSKGNTPVISSDVATFLENSVQTVSPKQKLTLNIHSDCIDEQEKVLYKQGIKGYYSDCLVATKREYMRNIAIAIILALIGLATLTVSIVLGDLGSTIWMEAVDIVAWVFCWEAVDVFVFKNRALRVNRRKYSLLIDMEINYFSISNAKSANQ